ncbi:MAG: hypothetical protein R3Y43_00795 [Alphaproteobacteria bacterium]
MKINTKKTTFKLFIVLIILSGGSYIYLNPHLIENIKLPQTTNKTTPLIEATFPNQDIERINQDIYNLKRELSQIPNFNLKADSANVANLENNISSLKKEIDILKEELNTVRKQTTKNSIILTSAIMLKDEILSNKPFSAQAFLLNNLIKEDAKNAENVQTIKTTSAEQIKSDIEIIGNFNQIYNQINKEEKEAFEAANQSTIKTKLDSFIKLKKTNNKNNDFVANQELETIKMLVENKNFLQAVKNIKKIDHNHQQINEKLNDWMNNVTIRENLLMAIDNVIANSIIAINLEEFNKE